MTSVSSGVGVGGGGESLTLNLEWSFRDLGSFSSFYAHSFEGNNVARDKMCIGSRRGLLMDGVGFESQARDRVGGVRDGEGWNRVGIGVAGWVSQSTAGSS
jgi:hypothetical protein